MTGKAEISILMTAYNRERYISEAIESVLASSYQNWELIIVDDCSKDNTVAIAKSYAAKDERIKVYTNEKNIGDYPNRNRAAEYATGKYLKYLDSDDRIYPHALETMIAMIESMPDAGWGISNFCDEAGGTAYPVLLNAKEAYQYHYFRQPIFFASPGQAVFTKKAFDTVGGFSEKRMVSDFEMWHKIALQSTLVLLPPKLVEIRTHARQEVADQQEYVVEYEKIKLQYLESKACPLSIQQVAAIRRQRRNTAFKIGLRKILSLNFKAAKPRLKVFWFYVNRR